MYYYVKNNRDENETNNYIFIDDDNFDCFKTNLNTLFLRNNISDFQFAGKELFYSEKSGSVHCDFPLNVMGWPLFSERFKSIFLQNKLKGIDFYPIKVTCRETKDSTTYYFGFTCNFIDAIDLERSKYRYIDKYDMYVFLPQEIYLDHNVCDGYDVFRCSKDKSKLYFSDKLVNLIVENNLTGMSFISER